MNCRKSSLTDSELETIAAYTESGPEWVVAHSTDRFWGSLFETFQKFQPAGSIIEIGCGGGRDAATLRVMGYHWTGTDPSVGMAEIARSKNLGPVYCLPVFRLDRFSPESFDAFWAAAVFLHIDRDRLPQALASIHRVVRPGGVGFISLKKGVGEKTEPIEVDGIVTKSKRQFIYYEAPEVDAALLRTGYEIVHFEEYKHSPEGRTPWLAYIVRRI